MHASFPSFSELILHDASVKNLAVYMSSQAVDAWIALLAHLCTRSQCFLQRIRLEWRVETKYEARVQLDGSLDGLVQNLIIMFPDVFTDHHTFINTLVSGLYESWYAPLPPTFIP